MVNLEKFIEGLNILVLASERPEVILMGRDAYNGLLTDIPGAAEIGGIDIETGSFPIIVRDALPPDYVMATSRSFVDDLDVAAAEFLDA